MYSLSIITDNSQTKYFFFSDVQLEDVTCGLCLRQLLFRLQRGKSATKGENDDLHDYIKDQLAVKILVMVMYWFNRILVKITSLC